MGLALAAGCKLATALWHSKDRTGRQVRCTGFHSLPNPAALPCNANHPCREQERMQKAEAARLETERILREQQVGAQWRRAGCTVMS